MANQIIIHHLLIKRRLFKGTFSLNRFIVIPPSNCKSIHSDSACSSLDNNNNNNEKLTNVNDTLKLFDVMIHQRPVPSVAKFTGLLYDVTTQLKHYSCSLHLFKQMCAFGFPVNKYTAGIAVKCYYRSHRTRHGLTVLGFCFKQGVEPHVFTCNMILKGFIREQMTYEAEQLFRLMINKRQLCEPNLATYNTMIEGLCKVGSHYAAIHLLKALNHGRLGGDCKFDVVTYNIIFDSLCKDVVMVVDVFKLFNEMVFRKAIQPNIHTYNSLIYNLSKLGYWDDVCLMLRRMKNENIHPNVKTFNIIVDALCKQGKINEAEAVIDMMGETGGKYLPDVVTYNSLIEAYGWSDKMHEARRIFDLLASKCIKPNSVTYNKLLLGYIWDVSIPKFLKFYKLSCDGRLHDSVWFALPWKYYYIRRLMYGKYKDAVALFHLMDGSGMNSDAYVHITLIRRAIKCRKFDDARRFFNDLLFADISEHKKKQRKAVAFKRLYGNLDRASRRVIFEECFPRVKLYHDML